MFGWIYLILAVFLGREITRKLVPENKIRETKVAPLWVTFPAAFGAGILFMTWAVYIAAWFLSEWAKVEEPLLGANLLVMGITAIFFGFKLWKKYPKKASDLKSTSERTLQKWDSFPKWKEMIFYLLLLFFISWIMFYVFHIYNGYLYSGFTVFGDYAPHTAMMRSFSLGNNYPTQYPHFGGADVKYHFMFQFLSGNLEYLGMNLDIAYNSVSILSLWCFFMILGALAKRLSGSFAASILSVLFLVFRSGTAFFRFAYEHWLQGDLWQTLNENTSFIGYTTNENWGLWNFNVYLNQRHLAFGLLLVGMALWVFWDWVEAGCKRKEKRGRWFYSLFFTREAWKSRCLEDALLIGMILGLCSFWNGAAVIGGLLILMGFAVFSEGKLDYLLTAVVTVVFSMLQSKIFVRGSVVSPAVYFGFLAEDKTLSGILEYLFEISGFVFLGIVVALFILKRKAASIAVSMLFPTIFAFLFSLTPDINVNHKYIMISYGFLTIFWAWAVVWLFRKKIWGKVLAVLLAVFLTVNGVYDFVVILKDNDSGHRVAVNMDSSLTKWLAENLKKDDLILTPEYSMNEVTMSGVMMYLGWPYYAWSAGYDTNYRAAQAVKIYTTDSKEELKALTAQEHITYILYEEGTEIEGQQCEESMIREVYPEVYRSEDGRIRIYGTEQ